MNFQLHQLHRPVLTFAAFLCIVFIAVYFAATSVQTESRKYERTIEKYTIPAVVLINQNGQKVPLAAVLERDQPVVVTFIYANCTVICPVLSSGFVNLQSKLAATNKNVRLLSITIDPEFDTPDVMKEYLHQYNAKPGWDFLTGSRADIDAVMKAFNAYVPNKMLHYPLNLIRNPKDGSWVRLSGILSSKDFLAEFEGIAGE
jgi:protein SCO1/2